MLHVVGWEGGLLVIFFYGSCLILSISSHAWPAKKKKIVSFKYRIHDSIESFFFFLKEK
jgi:hypothetical protein